MSDQISPLAILLAAVLALAVLIARVLVGRDFRSSSLAEVKHRLGSYAAMQRRLAPAAPSGYAASDVLLDPDEHAVLLGILKKIEAKNAALLRVWTFFGAACLTLFNVTMGQSERFLLTIMLGLILAFLTASLRGMRQVDQLDSRGRTLAQMQEDLVRDMLSKEASFRFSTQGARLAIALGALFLVLFLARALG